MSVSHTYREGNRVADWLAKMGMLGREELVFWERPLVRLGSELPADSMGVVHHIPFLLCLINSATPKNKYLKEAKLVYTQFFMTRGCYK